MEASATGLFLCPRNRFLVKHAEGANAAGAARDIVDVLVDCESQFPANSGAIAGVLPPALDRGPSTQIQNQIASHVAAC